MFPERASECKIEKTKYRIDTTLDSKAAFWYL